MREVPHDVLVRRFFGVGLIFLFIGGFIGVLMRWGLGLPWYSPFSAAFFFNLITVHPFMLIIGWAATTFMAITYYEFPKLTGARLYSTKLAQLQLALMVIGLLTILNPIGLMDALGILHITKELSASVAMFTAYPPLRHTWPVPVGGILLIIGMGLFFFNIIKTFRQRPRGNYLPKVSWFFIGGAITLFLGMILWTAVMILGILMPKLDPLFAKELIWIALRVFLQNGMLITLVGILLLWSMRLWGSPELYSPKVALIELPLFIPLASFPAHLQHLLSDPVPMEKKIIGTLTAELVLLTFVMSIFNVYLTYRHSRLITTWYGAVNGGTAEYSKQTMNPKEFGVIKRFFIASVVGYTLVCLTGAVQGTLPVNVIVHNTQWVPAHIHIVMLGTLTMIGITALYYYLPRLTGKQYSVRLANIQFVLYVIGVYWMVISLAGAGLRGLEFTSGMVRRAGITYDIRYWPYMFSSLIGLFIILASLVPFIINLLRLGWRIIKWAPAKGTSAENI
jgi:heme/copper-type cytochrome/quinol oxidase subunit 1